MMKIPKKTVLRWENMATDFLDDLGFKPDQVKTGADAWTIASRAGIAREAYEDENITDGHIQTALERIFPNAVFKDKKVY